jgi:hypothetical protein
MRHTRLWTLAAASIAGSALLVLGGVMSGAELGQLVAGYGFLLLMSGIYLAAGLAIRERIWRRVVARAATVRPMPVEFHGRRVF